ncbi:hypothetical protein [Streptomyces virginiae]|uniref:hypothetical protein n=1 Tax=Streptomyces virginiae TaxID=1961 RepID=UPI0030DFA894
MRSAEARPARIHRTTAGAILGIPLNTARRRERLLPGLVEADRAATSLQELAEHGWPTSFLADQLPTSTHTIAAIRNRERRRLAQTAARHRAPLVTPADEDLDDLDAHLALVRQPETGTPTTSPSLAQPKGATTELADTAATV